MEQRIASNLLSIIQPEVQRAQALIEAAQALQAILAQPQPPLAAPSPEAGPVPEPPA